MILDGEEQDGCDAEQNGREESESGDLTHN
jgi:hypothetical protein